jgi:O-antigen/teichoic acid export membrane protein
MDKLGRSYQSSWRRFTAGSMNRQVFRAAATIGFLASVAKFASVAKELLVARRFGVGSSIEAFLVAILIPMLAVNVVSGSFNIALIPTYITVRERDGRESAQRLLSGVTVWSLLLLILITVFIVVTARLYLPWIASGFNQRKLDLTFQLLWVVSPLVVLSGIANIWGAVLNAGERFALVALVPIITPAITVIVLFIKRDSIFALPVGMVIGAGVEMILLGVALKLRGVSLRPRWHGFGPHFTAGWPAVRSQNGGQPPTERIYRRRSFVGSYLGAGQRRNVELRNPGSCNCAFGGRHGTGFSDYSVLFKDDCSRRLARRPAYPEALPAASFHCQHPGRGSPLRFGCADHSFVISERLVPSRQHTTCSSRASALCPANPLLSGKHSNQPVTVVIAC